MIRKIGDIKLTLEGPGCGKRMITYFNQCYSHIPTTHGPQLGRINLLTPTRVSAASREIRTGEIVPLNLPLDVPKVPAFGREAFKHEVKILGKNVAYDDKYELNTQSGTQWDGFRHIAHFPTQTFYNGTKGSDIEGLTKEDKNKCGIHHWAQHGIAGRGILIDYWSYAKEKGIVYGTLH